MTFNCNFDNAQVKEENMPLLDDIEYGSCLKTYNIDNSTNFFTECKILTYKSISEFINLVKNMLKDDKLREKISVACQKNAKVFNVVSHHIINKRKWLDIILQYFQRNYLKNTYYLIVGFKITQLGCKANIIYKGSIYNDRFIALVYSDSDYFILRSREDNLPNNMLKSITFGKPVISFCISDNKELLENSIFGLLVDDISTVSFKKKMREAILNGISKDLNYFFNLSKSFANNKHVDLYYNEYEIIS
jgi:hypothetical protein